MTDFADTGHLLNTIQSYPSAQKPRVYDSLSYNPHSCQIRLAHLEGGPITRCNRHVRVSALRLRIMLNIELSTV